MEANGEIHIINVIIGMSQFIDKLRSRWTKGQLSLHFEVYFETRSPREPLKHV